MEELEKRIKEQIQKIKAEILEITNQIEFMRDESNDEDVSLNVDLQDKLEILSDKVATLQRNLAIYANSIDSKDITVGKTITITTRNIERKITLVLADDADSLQGYISEESPLGKALIGKNPGEEVVMETPNGEQKIQIKGMEK